MPKLARQNYNDYYSNNYYNSSNIYTYPQQRLIDTTPQHDFRTYKRPKKLKKKKSLAQVIVTLALFAFVLFGAMPTSFKQIKSSIFKPQPYKEIQADMEKIAFPTVTYLSNHYFLDRHMFSYSASEKKAKMKTPKENVNMPVLQQELINLGNNYKTISPSVFVWDYETQNYIDINASANYATASIIKIPVLIDVFKSIEAGQLTLDETIPLTEYYRTEGSGSLQFKAANSQYTIDKLAEKMITESDNSATNMLIARVGSMTDVNHQIRSWGLKDTQLHTWLPDMKGTNRTTAREMATMLYNIDTNEKFLTPESRAKIFDYMGHVHNNRLIQAGLGSGAKFYHKTGDIGSMLGDAGIVVTPNGKKYIVVILANRPHNSIAGKEYIVKASEIIYNYMVR